MYHSPSIPITLRFIALVLLYLCASAQAGDAFLIGFAQDTLGNAWRRAQVAEVQSELAAYPEVRFIATDARGNTALQAKHIEDLVASGIDLLITSPRDREGLKWVIEEVHALGIPVILLSRDVETDHYTTFIHAQNLSIGRRAARFLVERLDGKGRILMLEGVPGASTTLLRSRGFMEVVRDYPEITVLSKAANYQRTDAILAAEAILEDGIRFDAIYAHSDSMALGAMMALRRHGIAPSSLPIVGIDYIGESRAAIRAGDMAVTFTYPTGGREGAKAAMDILAGKPVPGEIVIESVRVDRDNVDAVEPIFQ